MVSSRSLSLSIALLCACGPDAVAPKPGQATLADCVADPACTRPLVVAYGYNKLFAPPNTLLGYRRAFEMGADLVQVDAHVSRDAKGVILYDEQLGRATTCTGSVRDWLAADVIQCGVYDATSDQTLYTPPTEPRPNVPLLAEVLAWAKGRVNLVIDVRRDSTGTLLKEVAAAGMLGQVLFLLDEIEFGLFRTVAANESIQGWFALYRARSAAETDTALARADEDVKILAIAGDADWMNADVIARVHAAGRKTFMSTFGPTDPTAESDEKAGKDRCRALFGLGYDLALTRRPDVCTATRILLQAP